MNDRELLELAAKAAGIEPGRVGTGADTDGVQGKWNPLTDDGDRYRLARTYGLRIDFHNKSASWFGNYYFWGEGHIDDEAHAIVRAAAEVGKGMK